MFSHLSAKELAFYGVSVSVGFLLLVAGVVGHARYGEAEKLASATTSSWNTSTTTGGTFVQPIDYPSTSTPDIIQLFSVETNKGSCGSGVIRVMWTSLNSDATYRLYRNGTKVFEGGKASYYDSGLPAGSTNSYIVYADTPGMLYNQVATALATAPAACETPGVTSVATTTAATTTTGTNTGSNSGTTTVTVLPRIIPIASSTPTPAPATSSIPTYTPPSTYVPPTTPVPVPTPVTNPPVTVAPVVSQKPAPDVMQPLVQSIERTLVQPTTTPSVEKAPLSTVTEAKVAKLFTVVSVFDETDKARAQARRALVAFVDEKIRAAFASMNDEERAAKKESLEQLRTSALARIDERLAASADVRAQATLLTSEIKDQMSVLSAYGVVTDETTVGALVDSAVAPLTTASEEESKALKEQGGDLLYKDTNKDGISDYDSVHVYNLDPVKPSPVSVYKGRKLTAGEKVELGFDPAQAKLVSVTPEEPEQSSAPVARSYQVSSVALTEEKKVALSGRALPNSFVTLYIYSTPVVVTVKTDANGSWKYTLNKELEDGSHSVSVATVDNSGKILAKSSPIPFTKTAQAATLDSASTSFISDAGQPTLFSGRTLYMLIMVCAGIIFFTLGIMGLNTRRQDDTPAAA